MSVTNLKSFRDLHYIFMRTLIVNCLLLVCFCQTNNTVQAKAVAKQNHRSSTAAVHSGSVYPQFASSYGAIHWLPEQMPLKVFVAQGQTVEQIIDPAISASAFNVDNLDHWPDVAANLFEQPEQINQLPIAQGYLPEFYQAAIAGISQWKVFEKEGLFSFEFTNDPGDADIYVFWVNHFVNNLGLGLFAKDIRGYTAKRSFWYREILSGAQAQFKPVITLLRTTTQSGEEMPIAAIKASAAHEFGHALGIEGHSNNPQDLMSIYYGRGVISANDAATVRHLYHMTPILVP